MDATHQKNLVIASKIIKIKNLSNFELTMK